MRTGRVLVFAMAAWLMTAVPARANWMISAFVGTAWTRPATLTLDRAALGTATFSGVTFESRSFASPLYYGYRGAWFRAPSGIGIEGELIHLKVYARPGSL